MSDIVSSIKDAPLPPKRSPQEALASGRVPYEKPTPENSVMLFIDHQVGPMVGVRDFPSLASYKANVVGLAKIARALQREPACGARSVRDRRVGTWRAQARLGRLSARCPAPPSRAGHTACP